MSLRQMNEAALLKSTAWQLPDEHSQKVFDICQAGDALAWGRSYQGLGSFCLVHGSLISQQLRTKLHHGMGIMSGQYEATIIDNDGAQFTQKEESLHLHDYKPPLQA